MVVGLIGLLLAIGLYLISCDQPDECDGKCWYGRDSWQDPDGIPSQHGCKDYEKGACYKDCAAHKAWKENYYISVLSPYDKYTCDCK